MPRNPPPWTRIGGRPSGPSSTTAPIRRRGIATRCMGRPDREASPESTYLPGRPASAPASNRIVVPELPASRAASATTSQPTPSTPRAGGTPPGGRSRPRRPRQAIVEATSAPGAAPRISDRPRAMAARMSARCETDLSPGTARVPRSRSTGVTVTSIDSLQSPASPETIPPGRTQIIRKRRSTGTSCCLRAIYLGAGLARRWGSPELPDRADGSCLSGQEPFMEQGHYGDVKDRLSRVLAEFAQLAERREGPGPAVRARQLLAKLDAERFNVVVVGEFKRGKTTFVNALLGAPVLPAAVVPLTSIVTAVGYAEKIEVEVTFRDGRRESVPVETISAYVTEPGNPHNRLGVRQVMLSYPSPQIRGGVFLVDTPGVGSIYAHNTEAAYEFVPEADAAIFLTSADPPISARERDFLIDVREYAERMFFISNKVDYLSDTERAESLAFTRRVLREALGSEPVLYPLSAKLALEARMRGDAAGLEASGLAAFERDFHDFLMREKGRAFLGSVGMQAAKLEADLNNALAVEEQSVRLPLEELRRRSDAMEVLFRDARIRRDDTGALLKKEFDAIVRMIEEDLEAIKAQHIEPLLRQVE